MLQGAGSVALALVAFALAFTWPTLLNPITGLRSDRARAIAFAGLGLVLLLAAGLVYATPGVLLRGPLGMLLAVPVGALWMVGAVALAVRGLVVRGAPRAISYAFAVVAVGGAAAGMVSAVLTQHGAVDTVTPTGGFLLAVGAVAAVILWARADEPEQQPRRARRATTV